MWGALSWPKTRLDKFIYLLIIEGITPAWYVPVAYGFDWGARHKPSWSRAPERPVFFVISYMRVSAFIDGFNLYHSIKAIDMGHFYVRVDKKVIKLDDCRWVNLRLLCQTFCTSNESLKEVYYFTAFAPWSKGKQARHRRYVKALADEQVQSIQGQFQRVSRMCRACGAVYKTHEEKYTDVNLSLHVLQAAYQNQCDKFIIVTADSDFVPAIKMLLDNFPNKQVHILFPYQKSSEDIKRLRRYNEPRQKRVQISSIKYDHLRRCVLPGYKQVEIVKPDFH